jgi:hypothetical protein
MRSGTRRTYGAEWYILATLVFRLARSHNSPAGDLTAFPPLDVRIFSYPTQQNLIAITCIFAANQLPTLSGIGSLSGG